MTDMCQMWLSADIVGKVRRIHAEAGLQAQPQHFHMTRCLVSRPGCSSSKAISRFCREGQTSPRQTFTQEGARHQRTMLVCRNNAHIWDGASGFVWDRSTSFHVNNMLSKQCGVPQDHVTSASQHRDKCIVPSRACMQKRYTLCA